MEEENLKEYWRIRNTQKDHANHRNKCPKCGHINKSTTYNPAIYHTPTLEELNEQGAAVVTQFRCSKCGVVLHPRRRKINWNFGKLEQSN